MKKSNDTIFIIKVPGFKEHQKDIKNRHYLALSTGFFANHKIREAKRECIDCIYCFQWLWENIDYETETLEIKETSLKYEWMDVCCAPSNRFDVMKRLNALSNAGLIVLEVVSNSVLTQSEHESNSILTSSEPRSNIVLTESESTLEQPETLMALRVTKTNKQTNKQTKETDFSESFLKFWELYPDIPRKVDKSGCWIKWKAKNLDELAELIHKSIENHKTTVDWQKQNGQFIPAPMVFINQSRRAAPISTNPVIEKTPHQKQTEKMKLRLTEKQWQHKFSGAILNTCDLQRLSDTSVFHQKYGGIDYGALGLWLPFEKSEIAL